jgi:hypothetical protein
MADNSAPRYQMCIQILPEGSRIEITGIAIGIRQIQDDDIVGGCAVQKRANIFGIKLHTRILPYTERPIQIFFAEDNEFPIDIHPVYGSRFPLKDFSNRSPFTSSNH